MEMTEKKIAEGIKSVNIVSEIGGLKNIKEIPVNGGVAVLTDNEDHHTAFIFGNGIFIADCVIELLTQLKQIDPLLVMVALTKFASLTRAD